MTHPYTNRLSQEKSPYLLQHAHNPVDWFPWGAEAFEKAKREDKPLLVSIGYSTCHWCHVMEHESFENEDVAKAMNQYFVCIKVDREERPDVDKLYMTAVSAMTGQGGWPLNAFVTPDLRPFFGGTYFPPEPRWNHPGWKDLILHIGEAWKSAEERQKMLQAAGSITDALKRYMDQSEKPVAMQAEWLDGGFEALQRSYDASRGGFSPAPKFPMPVYHQFLMRYGARTQNREALDMSVATLRAMAKGGIYDHLGGGFARYSTDEHWHVPHFEKMLYDNAQLAVNYLEAHQITNESDLKQTAQGILDYVLRDMKSPAGAFYSAEDADSAPHPSPLPRGEGTEEGSQEKVEGAFYVWEKSEIIATLGPKNGEIFSFRYGVRPNGNVVSDPHGEFQNKNVLYEAHPIPEVAAEFKLGTAEVEGILTEARRTLFQLRGSRPKPHLDDKILAAWNGLMVSALAKGYQILGDERYLKAAQSAAEFIQKHLYDDKNKILYRRFREGERQAFGIADDYAFVVQGFLDLYESDFNAQWLARADGLNQILLKKFYDPEKCGFYMTAADQDPYLFLRFVEDQDNVEPSASSVAALNLLRLSQFLQKDDYRDLAVKTIESFGTTLAGSPRSLPAMLAALDFALTDPRQIIIVGPHASPDTQALLGAVHRRFIPSKILMLRDPKTSEGERLPAFLRAMEPVAGAATAYVCEHFRCQAPVTTVQDLEKLLPKLNL